MLVVLIIFTILGLTSAHLQPFITPATPGATFGHDYQKTWPMSNPTWSSQLSGYLLRADPHPGPHSYAPLRPALKFLALRNSKVETQGFTLALFDDKVAIDSSGRVCTLKESDYDGITSLARTVSALPSTNEFRNQWRVYHPRTGYPIERILVPRSALSEAPLEDYAKEFIETSVYGFDITTTQLEDPVHGYTDLPAALWELTGVVLEAKVESAEKDEVMLARVKRLVDYAL